MNTGYSYDDLSSSFDHQRSMNCSIQMLACALSGKPMFWQSFSGRDLPSPLRRASAYERPRSVAAYLPSLANDSDSSSTTTSSSDAFRRKLPQTTHSDDDSSTSGESRRSRWEQQK